MTETIAIAYRNIKTQPNGLNSLFSEKRLHREVITATEMLTESVTGYRTIIKRRALQPNKDRPSSWACFFADF